MSFWVYILWSEKLGKYYVGSSNSVEARLKDHNGGEGKYTAKGIPWKLIWSTALTNRTEAVQLEMKIKKRGISRYLADNSITNQK